MTKNYSLGSWKHGGRRLAVNYLDLSHRSFNSPLERRERPYYIEVYYGDSLVILFSNSIPLHEEEVYGLEREINQHRINQDNPHEVVTTLVMMLNHGWRREVKKNH